MLWCQLWCRVGLRTCLGLHQQTGRERGRAPGGRKLDHGFPPPSAHNNSMAMGTPHVERWRGNIRLALFYEPSHSSTRGAEVGEGECLLSFVSLFRPWTAVSVANENLSPLPLNWVER